ncbi:MAG: hypothetical protein M3Q64_00720 [bacterium]|nr:hypothetical protein [bacterium]
MHPVEFDEKNDGLESTPLYSKEAEGSSFSLAKLLVRSGLAKNESSANGMLLIIACIFLLASGLIAWNMMSNDRSETIITPEEEFKITPLPIT